MDLNLKRPIAFFDLETTGTDVVKDRIVEISILKVSPNGKQETITHKVNPTIPIPPETTKIHGISNDDIKDSPKFADIAKSLAKFLEGCDLAGYNSNRFDVPVLVEEFLRADVDFDIKKRRLIDAQVIFHKMEQRTLGAAYKFYCNRELVDAHTAEADTNATFEVLKAQLDKYTELNNDMDALAKFSTQNNNVDFAGKFVYNDAGVEVFNFGKYKGTPVEEVFKKEPGYYKWMMNGDFPLYTKKVITAIQLRMTFANSKVG